MDPIDYTSAFNNLPNPTQAFTQGLEAGALTSNVLAAQQQRQTALAQQQQKQSVIQSLANNPNATADDYAKAVLQVPELHEQFKQAWETRSTAQQDALLKQTAEWSAAIQSGQPKVASDGMRAQADAIANKAGAETPESKALRTKADQVDANPQGANVILKTMMAVSPKGKDLINSIVKLGEEGRDAELFPIKKRQEAAKAGKEEVANVEQQMALIGQHAGALSTARNVRPEQVTTMFNALAARGIISKDELPDYLASIPKDAKELPAYLNTFKLAGMKPEDQMKYTTPDANTVANNATQVKTTGMNNATQLKVQDRIDARQDSKGDVEPSLDADTLSTMAQQYIAGDKSVMTNLGRGAQGSANIVALRAAIAREAKAQGLTGPQIAAKIADFEGLKAGLRTSANISARVENAISEAKELAPLAIEAGKQVARSGLLPFGKAEIMFNTQTNNPALKKFVTANNGLVSAYAGAMARGQKPTVSDYDHARHILAEAQSQEAYEATVQQMYAEMEAASRAPQNVRNHLRTEIGGAHGAPGSAPNPAAPPVAAPAIPSGWSVRVH